jgi:MFS family permease
MPPADGSKPISRFATTVLLALANVVERADLSALPAVFFEIQRKFDLSPSQLGLITCFRGVASTLFSGVAGVVGNRYNRATLIGAGCIFWGVACVAMGASQNFSQLLVSRSINGLGIGLVVPLMNSLVADMYSKSTRGRAFGLMQTTGNIGGSIGALVATNMAAHTILQTEGWRAAMYLIAVVSIAVGACVIACARDFRPGRPTGAHEKVVAMGGKELWREMQAVARVRTFQIIIAQGLFGNIPWQALPFLTLWFQLSCFSHAEAASLTLCFNVGTAVGGLLGGYIGDRAAQWSPDHGRVYVAQFSVTAGLPLTALVLFVYPPGQWFELYAATLFTMGASISWCFAGVNAPVLSEIVPARLRSTVFGVDRMLEGTMAALAGPATGLLAERVFGWDQSKVSAGDACNKENARALGSGLFWVMALPWIACLFFFTLLHWTYRRDRLACQAEIGEGEELVGLSSEDAAEAEAEDAQPMPGVPGGSVVKRGGSTTHC